MRDTQKVTSNDSLFDYPIENDLGSLTKTEKVLLNFVIDDKSQYRIEYSPIRQPFNPDFVLEFSSKKQCAYLFVSFGTGEIAIADVNGFFKFYLMSNSSIMERWYDYVMNNRINPKK